MIRSVRGRRSASPRAATARVVQPVSRARAGARSPASADHASQANPEIVRKYGEYLWFDPGEPAAADHFIAVLNDVVRRYDIDGVHIDDYFYPYQIKDDAGKLVPFPDDASYDRAVGAASDSTELAEVRAAQGPR